jgi:hypothetical protein
MTIFRALARVDDAPPMIEPANVVVLVETE